MECEGRIIKLLAGFYYVATDDGIYECRAKGELKHRNVLPLVGDYVLMSKLEESPESSDSFVVSKGILHDVIKRRNSFIRPPVANVDYFVAVVAADSPEPNLYILDKSLVAAEAHNTQPVVCVNKKDLDSRKVEEILEIYSDIYPCIAISANADSDLSDLIELISGGTAVFSGPSGVGKSTLVNALMPKASVEIGVTSHKSGRGRHTTRHTEIFSMNDFYIIDTPGFTSFDIPEMDLVDLGRMFPEFEQKADECRFDDCLHINEPKCGVKKAVMDSRIKESRYSSYRAMLKGLSENSSY